MFAKNYIDMSAAVEQIKNGEKFTKVDRDLAWVPSNITEEHVEPFLEAVKSTYESDSTEFEFAGQKFEVEFVPERKDLRLKPGFNGRTDVMLNEQIIRSFNEVRQAKVFYTHLEHKIKNDPKKPFEKTLVKKVTSI